MSCTTVTEILKKIIQSGYPQGDKGQGGKNTARTVVADRELGQGARYKVCTRDTNLPVIRSFLKRDCREVENHQTLLFHLILQENGDSH